MQDHPYIDEFLALGLSWLEVERNKGGKFNDFAQCRNP
jgi:hypothetical protein